MPRFDFRCRDCETTFEEVIRNGDIVRCARCGGTRTEKLLSPPPVIFRGSGFFKTDSAKAPPRAAPNEKTKKEDVEAKKPEVTPEKTEKNAQSKPKSAGEKGLASENKCP